MLSRRSMSCNPAVSIEICSSKRRFAILARNVNDPETIKKVTAHGKGSDTNVITIKFATLKTGCCYLFFTDRWS